MGTNTTAPVREHIQVAGLDCWRVSGPYGVVDYMPVGNHLRIVPTGGEEDSIVRRWALQARDALARSEEDLYALLDDWYHRLPGLV